MTQKISTLFILILLVSLTSCKQESPEEKPDATIFQTPVEEIVIEVTDSLSNQLAVNIKYPLIKTGESLVDAIINDHLKIKYMGYEFKDIPVEKALNHMINNGLTTIDYEVSYNNNDIISIQIHSESCAAYCTTWTEYLNYNTKTGALLQIDDIINPRSNFKFLIEQQMKNQYGQLKKVLKNRLESEEDGLDTEIYEYAIENYEKCEKEFHFNDFKITNTAIEIKSPCYFIHAYKPLEPALDLKIEHKNIKGLLIQL